MNRIERDAKALEKTREEYQNEVTKLRKNLVQIKKMNAVEKEATQKLIDEYNIKIEMINVSIYRGGRDTNGPIVESQDGVKKYTARVKRYFELYMQKYYPTVTEETARTLYSEINDEVQEDYDRNLRNLGPSNIDR